MGKITTTPSVVTDAVMVFHDDDFVDTPVTTRVIVTPTIVAVGVMMVTLV